MATAIAPRARAKPSLPPLLDPKLKTRCECHPAPICVDESAIGLGLQCMKCGHTVTFEGFARMLRYALKRK